MIKKKLAKKHLTLSQKKTQAAELAKLIDGSKTIAIVNLASLPNKQLKAARAKLRDKLQMVFAKKTAIKLALKNSKRESAKQLEQYLAGVNPAIIFTDLDAFELMRLLKTSRQMVAAKPGQVAPEDIRIEAGPTPFAPGPAISELAQLGLKTKVEGGKIHIRESAIAVKAGNKILGSAASILAKLGVKPIQIGITLTQVLENDELYPASVLDIDDEKFAQDVKSAVMNAFKLAIELGFATKETIKFLVQKAQRQSKALETKIASATQGATTN